MEIDMKKIVTERRTAIIEKIDEYNEALKENDAAKMGRIEQELKEAESAYSEAKCKEVFKELKQADNPIKAAVEKHSYLVVSHKTIREDGVVKGFEIVEDKPRQIDLVKLAKLCNVSPMWEHSVQRFNQLLAMRTAKDLKMSNAQIKKICDSFYMSDLARQIDLGGTPDSNRSIGKQLQLLVDGILFEDDGKGKNIYKVNSHDVAYLLKCYTKRGKKTLSVAVAKNAYMYRLVLDIMHRIVTGKSYDLEYRMVSTDKPKTDSNASVVEEPKVEQVTEKTETVVIDKKSA